VVTVPPSDFVTAGSNFGFLLAAEDAQGNIDTNYNGTLSLALASGPPGTTLGGDTTAPIVNGLAETGNLLLTKAASGYSIVTTSDSLTPVTTGQFTVIASSATHLAVTNQPPSSVSVNGPFGLVVSAEDNFGNVDTNYPPGEVVTLTLGGGPAGAMLGGNTSVSPTAGVATFTNLTLDKAGTYTIHADSDDLNPATTGTITANPAQPATHLVITAQPPASVAAGATFGLMVAAEDDQGAIDPNYHTDVALALATGPTGGTLGGTTTATPVNGVATFSGLTLSPAGSYTIGATSDALTPATTNTIEVTAPIVATRLVITAQPPASVTSGGTFGLMVTAEDDQGNIDTSYHTDVALALDTSPIGGALGGTTTATPIDGVATFSGLSLDKVGDYTVGTTSDTLTPATSSTITVTPAAATHLVVTAQPPSSVTAGGTFGLMVSAEDGQGNIDTNYHADVALALATGPSGGALGGTATATPVGGVASFSGLTLDKAGTYTIGAASDTLTPATSNPIAVTHGQASQLVVTTQPPGTIPPGSAFGLIVAAEDRFGNVDTGYSSPMVTLTIATGPTGGVLDGAATVSPTSGVATFANLILNLPGSYTLVANSGDLTPATTSPSTVSAATSTTALTAMPTTAAVGSTITFKATVTGLNPTGMVTFTEAVSGTPGVDLGTQPLVDGAATLPVATFGVGTHSVFAHYSGDPNNQMSDSNTVTVTINALPSNTKLTPSTTASTLGLPVTFTATVGASGAGSAPVATGSVTFLDNNTTIGTATLTNGAASLSTSALGAGTHAITASYGGDGNFGPSSSAVTALSIARTASTTTLIAAPNPSTSGQAATFTVTVAGLTGGPTPTGTVTFLDGTTALRTATLSGGVATFTISTLSVGAHAITASYGGDANYLSSSSAALTQQVSAAAAAGPTVANLQRFGFHAQPTLLVLTFSAALDPIRAANVANYTLTGGSNRFPVTAAVYNPTNHSVTLMFRQLLNVHRQYTLTVNGTGPDGLTSSAGVLIDGASTGRPGSNHVRTFGQEVLAGPASSAGLSMALVRKLSHRRISARAVDALLAAGQLRVERAHHRARI
jgi:hypothetical protein